MRRLVVVLAVVAMFANSTVAGAGVDDPATTFIVNGDATTIDEWPAYAQIHIGIDGFSRSETFVCGGSVVASRLVLTAAHCMIDPDLDVIVGSGSLTSGGTRVHVSEITVHPDYDESDARNDIALLKLASAVDVDAIDVVGPSSDYRWKGEGHSLTVVGLGCTEPDRDVCFSPSGGPSPSLRRADIASRSDDDCDVDLSVFGGIDAATMLCAGEPSDPFGSHNAVGACYGDSGGPLMVEGPSRPVLIGTVSWGGSDCGDYPVVYSRLANYRTWLADHGVPIARDPFDDGPAIDIGGTYTPVVGDFNGDGRDDILWYGPGTAGDVMKLGSSSGGFVSGPAISIGATYTPAVGDFNGDGRDDIFWYRAGTGGDLIRLGSSSGGFSSGPTIDVDGTYTPVAGDFNGDGRGDVLLHGPGSAADLMRLGSPSGGFSSGPAITVSGTYTRAIVGDYNGGGNDDILWYTAGVGGDVMRLGNDDGSFRSGPATNVDGTYTPIVGRFAGNDRADIFWYTPGTGADLLREATSSAGFVTGPEVVVNTSNFTPFGGDFDGDGTGDVFWYRAGSSSDVVWLGNPSS